MFVINKGSNVLGFVETEDELKKFYEKFDRTNIERIKLSHYEIQPIKDGEVPNHYILGNYSSQNLDKFEPERIKTLILKQSDDMKNNTVVNYKLVYTESGKLTLFISVRASSYEMLERIIKNKIKCTRNLVQRLED